ncbi:MAG: recombinase family protein [Sulfurovum sp.]|nr:recombinase family protein [Sulfurovum sp.]
MVYSYLRQTSDNNSLAQQQQYIISYCMMRGLTIDKEIMEYSCANHTIEDREKFEAFIHSLEDGDLIIAQNLPILSCHLDEIIKIINCMLSHKVDLHITDSKTLIYRETDITELFPLLNNMTEEQKKQKKQIGRPKGSKSSSKFDTLQPQIVLRLKEKVSVSAIARELCVSRSSLKDYIESRELRRLTDNSWIEISLPVEYKEGTIENPYLICPFEENLKKEMVQ